LGKPLARAPASAGHPQISGASYALGAIENRLGHVRANLGLSHLG
jgi:hypothetical protein